MTTLEEFRKKFREKWGRFYYSDKVDMDWEKPEKVITKGSFPCIASDEIEEDLFKALETQKKEADALRKKEKCATAEAVARDTKFMIRKKIEGYFEHRILLDTPEEERDNIINLIK